MPLGALFCICALGAYWAYALSGPKEVFDPTVHVRELQAELVRQRADCQAEKIEFPNIPDLHATCNELVKVMSQQLQDYVQALRSLTPTDESAK